MRKTGKRYKKCTHNGESTHQSETTSFANEIKLVDTNSALDITVFSERRIPAALLNIIFPAIS